MRVDFNKACQVVNMLCEGMGIRACERLAGLNRHTILGILETAGEKCAQFLDEKVRNVKAENVQVDEVWTFVNSKPQNTPEGDKEHGEFFTYLSVDRASKLIINWSTVKRDKWNTWKFMEDLQRRLDGSRFQLTTDAYQGYWRGPSTVGRVFGDNVDYATETKVFGRQFTFGASQWRNPLTVIGIKRKPRLGNPDMSMATTCHAERTNLSVRLFTRRFTRSTLGYSKKLENLRHAVAMFVCHFDFCRTHSAHGKTPAQAANLTDHVWKIEEILKTTI